MTAAREEILARIKSALRSTEASQANQAGGCGSIDGSLAAHEVRRRCEAERKQLLNRFESELEKIGAKVHHSASIDSTADYVERVALKHEAKSVITTNADCIGGTGLATRLGKHGISCLTETSNEDFRQMASDAGIGVSGVDYALADTGTLVLLAGKGQARSVSLLPAIHIAIVNPDQIVSGLDDLFTLLRFEREDKQLTSAVTFITGPSRTADIELTLVIGVHGPQELHVVVVEK